MRINETFTVLNSTLSASLRRQYPLVYTQKLTDSYDNLTLPDKLENSLAKIPYIEALPQYKNNPKGKYNSGLGALLDPEILGKEHNELINFMERWKPEGVFFDPYFHQVEALRAWSKGSDIVVNTGTGSGKTECFLWPIVGHLHDYARRNKDNPGPHRGIKALILYPMNALVADQLKRLRQLLGREDLAEDLAQGALVQGGMERTFQFGQYTGRTKFHGSYAKQGTGGGSVNPKVRRAWKQFNTFTKIRNHSGTRPELIGSLYSQMMDIGLIPAKGIDEFQNDSLFWDMKDFNDYEGAPGRSNAKLITAPGDRELFFRHEMHNTGYANLKRRVNGVEERRITEDTNGGGTPDVLVTNYSMLEYMLKRPLEHGMFHETKQWLDEDPENKLMLVLDEAHLYQGALGTEVGLLVRRLLSTLGILDSDNQNKVQFILTSASLGDDKQSKEKFVHGLTGRPRRSTGIWSYQDSSDVNWSNDLSKTSIYIKGEKWIPNKGDCTNEELTDICEELINLDYKANSQNDYLLKYFLEKAETPDEEKHLTEWLRNQPIFRRIYMILLHNTLSLDEVGRHLFGVSPNAPKKEVNKARLATEAVLNLIASLKGPRPDSNLSLPLLGIRAHLLYRGLPRLYWDLGKGQILLREQNSLDVAYPVRGCRQCGAPYASIWISQEDWIGVRAAIKNGGACTIRTFSRPVDHSIRLEVYIYDNIDIIDGVASGNMEIDGREIKADGPAHIWVNTNDYQIKVNPKFPGANWKAGHLAAELRSTINDPVLLIDDAIRSTGGETGRSNVEEITFCKATCLQCNTLHRRRKTDQITDYMTKGDDAFSQLMKELISYQKPDPKKDHLPNKGKKVMVFSDSRSRAAKLAKKIQDNSNYDELRLLLLHLLGQDWYKNLPSRIKNLDNLYSTFVMNCIIAKLEPFSGTGDKYRNPRNAFARTRVDLIASHAALLYEYIPTALFKQSNELKTIVEAAKGEIPFEDRAKNFYDEYVSRAPRTNDNFDSERVRYFRQSHISYVKYIRKEILSNITRGVINNSTGSAFINSDKYLILGVCFDPEFYSEEGDIDPKTGRFNDMIERLSEMDITFESNSIQNNSIRRFEEIISKNQTDVDIFMPSSVDLQKSQKWRDLMKDIKKLSLFRIDKLRNIQRDNNSKLSQSCRIHINSANYTLSQFAEVARQIIDILPSLLTTKLQREHWENVYNLSNLERTTPWDFSSAIMDFIGSKDFSLSSLGLGYAGSSSILKRELKMRYLEDVDEEQEEELTTKFNAHWEESLSTVITELIHWMTRPSMGTDSEAGKERSGGQRCIFSSSVFHFHSMKHHSSVYTNEEEWGIIPNRVKNKYKDLLDNMKSDIIVPFTDIRAILFESNPHQDASGRLLVKSEVIELKHLLDEDSEIIGCRRCGITMPKIHEGTLPKCCINCGYNNLLDYDAGISIFDQRIESSWRKPAIKAVNSSYEDLAITVIRAEEHTAQINTAKDEEEMYTSAEEFELLFQDVPFTVPEEDDAWTFIQSPVDILSCTTTMEVGIDIGSLSCVALRTIPRKASNYQQRVGRAGRGTAEVCVAVSWCDNQPHAQNYFDNPGEMLTPPQDSPVIYLNNQAIIERHINAAIFQAFFKRMTYNLRNRRFEGMGEGDHEANLMESMGTLLDFFSDDDSNEFSHNHFVNWLDGINPSENENKSMTWSCVRPQIKAILPEELRGDLDRFVRNLRDFLQQVQANKFK